MRNHRFVLVLLGVSMLAILGGAIQNPSDLRLVSQDVNSADVAATNPIYFPSDFLFGASIAGFQADMGCPTLAKSICEDPHSDWFAFATSPWTVWRKKNFLSGQNPSDVGPGHWELYGADIDRLRNEVHLNGFRFSIEWSRIFPKATDGIEGYENLKRIANADAIAHYHAVLDALHTAGVTPLVTINHYTLPLWIHDGVGCNKNISRCSPRGWLDKDRTVREIAKYAGFVAREFGGKIDRWATLNEPLAILLPGYLMPSPDRTNPPAVAGRSAEAKIVLDGLIESHARMYDAIKANDLQDADEDGKNSIVGVVYAMSPVQPLDPNNPLDQKAAQNVFYLWNMVYLNAVALGMYDKNLDGNAVYREDLANRMDYIGINYYTRITVSGLRFSILPGFSPLMTFNPTNMVVWEDYPKGIYEMIMVVKNDLGLPSIISENGTSDPNDEDVSASFLVRHLTWVGHAIEDGADVGGYFYWTLTDNFEWNHGMNMRFGLYAVDANDPEKKRTARKAASVYSGIAQSGMISSELQEMYPTP